MAVLQAPDGGYMVAGVTGSLNSENLSRMFLFKTDASGTLHWIKTYGDGDNNTACYSLINTSDGGYILAGKSWPKAGNSTSPGEDVYAVKTDAEGNVQWSHYYGGQKNDSGLCIVQSDDGGYAILGYTESFGDGGKDAFLIKTDAVGDLLWNTTYGSKKDDAGYYLLKTADGGYAITGRIMSDATDRQSNHFIYLIMTDTNGTIIKETGYTDPDSTFCYSIANGSFRVMYNVVVDGHYHISFTDNNGSKIDGYAYVANGNIGDTVGHTSIPFDNGQITAGYTESHGSGMKDVYLMKSLPSLYLYESGYQWEQTYGGKKDDIGYSIAPTNDGGQIIVGDTGSFGYGGKDVYLLKIKYNWTGTANYMLPARNSTEDSPHMTDLIQFLSTPVPTPDAPGPKPSPDITFWAIPALFIALALRKMKT